MWFFKKQTSLVGSGILEGFTDYHSHILPGVDDGIQTLGESLDTLDCLEKLGVKSIWLTPQKPFPTSYSQLSWKTFPTRARN